MNNKAVSEVIGVILMVAITCAIAVTVYIYVTGSTSYNPIMTEESITGNLVSIEERGDLVGLYFDDDAISLKYLADEEWFVLTTYLGENVTVSYEYYDYPEENIRDDYNEFLSIKKEERKK